MRLVGVESLSFRERFVLEIARSIREDFLQQSAFQEVDTFSSLRKQYLMLKLIITYYQEGLKALEKGLSLRDILSIPSREKIGRAKYIPEENIETLEKLIEEVQEEIANKLRGEVESNV